MKANVRERAAAAMIDLLLIVLLDAAIILPLYFLLHLPPAVCLGAMPVCHVLYCTLFCLGSMGATPGMFFCKLCVGNRDAESVGADRLLLRAVFSFFSCLPLGLGLLLMLSDKEHCTVYDYASGVFVYSLRQSDAPKHTLAFLRVRSADGETVEYEVPTSGVMIGRNPESCQILFPAAEPDVSRQHCIVKFNPQTGMFLLRDCGSTCGTFLEDGTRVCADQFTALNAGDAFYVGAKKNRFVPVLREE